MLGVLHDHSMLSQVFWPPSLTKVLEEKRTDPSSTELLVGPSNVRTRAKLTTQTDGVVCTEDMPLGLQFTVTYRIVGRQDIARDDTVGAESTSSLLGSAIPAPDCLFYLEEERTVLAPKPLSSIVSLKDGPVMKTQNLVRVLEELGQNGKDMTSALGSLKPTTEKHKGD